MAGRDERRVELGVFLRYRRDRFVREDGGGPKTGRRRVAGLRHDEVAARADIGVDWYTQIEQGRAKHPSVQVLVAIARALRLTPDETKYVLDLARPATIPASVSKDEGPAVRHHLDTVQPSPAFVVGRSWQLLAWNRAAARVFGDFDGLPIERRNLAMLLFTSGAARRFVVDWDERARDLVADLRARWAEHPTGDGFDTLIGRLSEVSEEFRRWWERRVVARLVGGRRELEHPVVGRLVFELLVLGVEGSPGSRLLVYQPLPEADTLAKLGRLLDHAGAKLPDIAPPPAVGSSASPPRPE